MCLKVLDPSTPPPPPPSHPMHSLSGFRRLAYPIVYFSNDSFIRGSAIQCIGLSKDSSLRMILIPKIKWGGQVWKLTGVPKMKYIVGRWIQEAKRGHFFLVSKKSQRLSRPLNKHFFFRGGCRGDDIRGDVCTGHPPKPTSSQGDAAPPPIPRDLRTCFKPTAHYTIRLRLKPIRLSFRLEEFKALITFRLLVCLLRFCIVTQSPFLPKQNRRSTV